MRSDRETRGCIHRFADVPVCLLINVAHRLSVPHEDDVLWQKVHGFSPEQRQSCTALFLRVLPGVINTKMTLLGLEKCVLPTTS